MLPEAGEDGKDRTLHLPCPLTGTSPTPLLQDGGLGKTPAKESGRCPSGIVAGWGPAPGRKPGLGMCKVWH